MPPYKSNSLLLVEDDANDVFLIKRAFKRANFKVPVSVVSDGDEAIGYLQGIDAYGDRAQHPIPSLIMLDLKLPRRSGLEVLEWLRAQPVLRRIPVIILTSSQESIDVDKAYEVGVNSYLVKPVTFNELSAMAQSIESYWLNINQYPSIYTPA
ncbi:MAG: response regulator [Phormidesmis sp.]